VRVPKAYRDSKGDGKSFVMDKLVLMKAWCTGCSCLFVVLKTYHRITAI
jgi:hypothetical protein